MTGNLHITAKLNAAAFSLDVAFDVPPGITALFGPSGSGKTTIADLIAGIRCADHGRITLGGDLLFDAEMGTSLSPDQRKIGYVFQDALLFPHMTVAKNLAFGAETASTQGREQADEIIALFDLEPLLARYPARLSGGEARRVAIARALLANPRALLLDEPMSGIDPARRQAFYPYLEKMLAKTKIPVLYITHQLDEILRLADRVVMLEDGKVLADGTPEDLSRHPEARRHLGDAGAGVILSAKVLGEADGLTELAVPGARLKATVPATWMQSHARLRILSRDIAIARARPEMTSVLNILACRISNIADASSGDRGEIDVFLELTDEPHEAPATLIARITNASQKRLDLKTGETVYAMIKAVAAARPFQASAE